MLAASTLVWETEIHGTDNQNRTQSSSVCINADKSFEERDKITIVVIHTMNKLYQSGVVYTTVRV